MRSKLLMKRLFAALFALWMLFACACSSELSVKETASSPVPAPQEEKQSAPAEPAVLPDPEGAVAEVPVEGLGINGWSLSEFTIVYSEAQPDYTARAALWLQNEIRTKTGVELPLATVESLPEPAPHEIVVGETSRDISKALAAKADGLQCSFLARRGHVALEGESFVIAAAAYRFVTDYLGGKNVPAEITVADPVTAPPKHFVLLIGDGMGQNHVKLFEAYRGQKVVDYTDGEDDFYGNRFPYRGLAVTNNLEGGTTDSAAAGTALSTGCKTSNGRIGRSAEGADLLSITELAASRGMATAVMSTEVSSGATPSAFSAHADNRSETEAILASQKAVQAACGTVIDCDYNVYTAAELTALESALTENLATLYANQNGSFIMYEEAYIDKHSHNNELLLAFKALARFNQAIGIVMEQAFYHPDTLVVITADHETGSLVNRGQGKFSYTSTAHSNFKVPVFAYGQGAEVFHGQTVENVQIPKTLAKLMGASLAAETDAQYPPLH